MLTFYLLANYHVISLRGQNTLEKCEELKCVLCVSQDGVAAR